MNDPGVWGPAAAGTLEKGETYESNVYKEAEEEIGLSGVKFEIGPKQRVTYPRNFFVQWYTVKLDRPLSSFKPQEDEVEKLAWVKPEDLKKDVVEHPENYVPYMSEVLKILEI